MLNILSQEQRYPSLSLRYLVPFQWWQHICLLNDDITNLNDLVFTQPLILGDYIQVIDSTQKQSAIRCVNNMVSFLQIDNLILNPKLKNNTIWKPVSSNFFQTLKRKVGNSLVLPLFFENDEKIEYVQIKENTEFKCIKLLLCSLTQNHYFYGYIGAKLCIKNVIKQILTFFEYFNTQQTKVTFLETHPFRNHKFQFFNSGEFKQGQLIMIHGLQRFDQKLYEESNSKRDTEEYFISSFENPIVTRMQRDGQELTMADEDTRTLSEHTLSTGAQTPFSFALQDQDWDLLRQYQNYGLFGQKLPEQIQNMKQYARQAIYSDIIQVPLFKSDLMMVELEKLAQDIQDNLLKRKIYHRQLAKEGKQYYKEFHYSNYSKETHSFKEIKEFSTLKTIESQKKIKQLSTKIHYSKQSLND